MHLLQWRRLQLCCRQTRKVYGLLRKNRQMQMVQGYWQKVEITIVGIYKVDILMFRCCGFS